MSQVIVISGMHRSGTSLVSSLLQRAGVNVGDRLLAANSANPRGYFEDADFYEFHETLLHERNQSYLYLDPAFDFRPTQVDWERAQRLIDDRSRHQLWGWKDPRTSLVLEFWHKLLPEARFVFVYRHPLDVLLSLLRRGDFDSHPCLASGLQAWLSYNSRIKAFYDQHPDQCLLVHIDALVGQFRRFVGLLETKLRLDVELDSQSLAQTFHAGELKATPQLPEAVGILSKIFPEPLALTDLLNARADLPAPAEAQAAASPALSQLRPLAEFVGNLPEPIDMAVSQSVLQMLVSSLAPEPVAKMLRRYQHEARGCQQLIDWQWMRSQRLERANAEQQAQLHERALRIEQQQLEIGRQSTRIHSLLAELEQVYQTRTWKLVRALNTVTRRGNKMNACESAQSGESPPPPANSIEAGIARLHQMHSELRKRPVTGSFAAVKRAFYKVIRTAFAQQHTVNAATLDLIERIHLEQQRDRLYRVPDGAASPAPAHGIGSTTPAGEISATSRERMAVYGQTHDQAKRNNVRHLQGFDSVYFSPAQMRMPERVALYSLILGLQPHNCLEIGGSHGGSSAIICAAMDDIGYGQLACVDAAPEIPPELWARINHRCQLFEGSSPEILPFVAKKMGAAFDFALIAGDQAYDHSCRDIAGVLPILSRQAYLLVHDAHSPGVKKAIEEAVGSHPELTDCGLISTEPAATHEDGHRVSWAGLRLLRFRRAEAA